jgi:hypothetical protein
MYTIIALTLLAQVGPVQQTDNSPRGRRAARERAVAKLGEEARPFIEEYGAAAVAAVENLTPHAGKKLAEFHKSGDFGRLPAPPELLRILADRDKGGDEVALWVIAHHKELEDPDAWDAFSRTTPLEYVLGLKNLKHEATRVRSNRLEPPPALPWYQDRQNLPWLGAGVGTVVLVIYLFRRKPAAPVKP